MIYLNEILTVALSGTILGLLYVLYKYNNIIKSLKTTKSSGKYTGLNHPSMMSVEYNSDMTVVDIVNPKTELLFNLSPKQIIGVNSREFEIIVPKKYHKQIQLVKEQLKKAQQSKTSQYFEYTVELDNEKTIYAICFAEYINDNKIYCHLARFESKSVYTGREKFTNEVFKITDNFATGIFLRTVGIDNDKEYVQFNEYIKTLYGTESVTDSAQWNQQQEDTEDDLVLQSEGELTFSRTITDKSGNPRHIKVSKRKTLKKSGGYYIGATLNDITEIVSINDSLNHANLHMQLALDASSASVWRYDTEKSCFQSMYGNTLMGKETPFETALTHVHPDEQHYFVEKYNDLLTKKISTLSHTFKFINNTTGDDQYISSEMATVLDSEGNVIEIVGIQKDVTAEHNTRRELDEKLKLLNLIYENIPLGIAYLDKTGTIIDQNRLGVKMLSHNETFLERNIFKMESVPSEIKNELSEGRNAQKVVTFTNRKTKQIQHYDLRVVIIRSKEDTIEGYLGIYNDITELIENSKNMEELALRYRAVINSINSGIEIRDIDGKIIDTNEAVFDLFGVVDREEYLDPQRKITDHPGIDKEILEDWSNCQPLTSYLDLDFDKIAQENYFRTNRTGKCTLEFKNMPLHNHSGDIMGNIMLISDVSENVMLNKKYKDLYRRQEQILSMLPVGVEVYAADGTLIIQNKVDQELFGGGDLTHKINIFNNPHVKPEHIEILAKGDYIKFEIDYSFEKVKESNYYYTTHSGVRNLDLYTSTVKDEDGTILYYMLIIQDRTDMANAQKLIEKTNLKLKMAINSSAITPWDYDCIEQKFIVDVTNDLQVNFKPEDALALMNYRDDDQEMNLAMSILKERKSESFTVDSYYHYTETAPLKYGTVFGQPFEYNSEGQVIRYTGFVKETTQWKNMTMELERLNKQNQLIINNNQSGFIYLTPDYIIQWENVSTTFKNLEMAQAYKQGTICYKQVRGMQSPCPNCPVTNALKKGVVSNAEIEVTCDYYAEILATPIFNNGALEGVVLRVDNVTERKKINLELEQAKEKAEQSNQLKSAFLANMSHEIRTPLNAIVGFSDIILSAETEEEKAEFRRIISTNSEILLNLINDILDLSKIESGYLEITKENINLSELFDEIKMTFTPRTKPGVELIAVNPYTECRVDGLDKQRVLQIMSNFISNAIKFTSKGSITIGYKYENKGIKLYVQDTGFGISKDNQHKVFQRFNKFNNFAQGTGLGLSICKAIADAMEGTIGFESVENKGSLFWVWLPCEVEITDRELLKANLIETGDRKATNIENLRILVAEDNDSNYLLIRSMLKKCRLTRAHNGQETIDMASAEEFDVILMDMRMPIMDGIEATERLRKLGKQTPIIALTANAFESDRVRALEAGCNEFVSKPINKEKLIHAIIYN